MAWHLFNTQASEANGITELTHWPLGDFNEILET